MHIVIAFIRRACCDAYLEVILHDKVTICTYIYIIYTYTHPKTKKTTYTLDLDFVDVEV